MQQYPLDSLPSIYLQVAISDLAASLKFVPYILEKFVGRTLDYVVSFEQNTEAELSWAKLSCWVMDI